MPAKKNNGSVLLKLGLALAVLAGLALVLFFSFQSTARVKAVTRDNAIDGVTGSVLILADGGIRELKSEAAGKVVWCDPLDPDTNFKEGDELVRLDTTELTRARDAVERKYKAEVGRAEIRHKDDPTLKLAEDDVATAERLHAINAISDELLDTAKRKLAETRKTLALTDDTEKQAKADYEVAMEDFRLQLEKMTIRAQFDGKVEGPLIRKGDFIVVGQPVARIFANKRIVAVKISEENFGRVKVGQPAKLRLLTYGSESYDATVSKLLPTADDAQRFTVYLDVKVDPELLRPGSTGEATITAGVHPDQPAIPRRALFNNDQVLVVKDGRIERRTVVVGFVSLNAVEVREGLAPGELVVVENQERFLPGKRVRVEVIR